MSVGNVPRERLAAIIERVLPEFGGDRTDARRWDEVQQAGPLETMASDIGHATGMSREAVSRRLRTIRTGNGGISRYTGKPMGDTVTFATADKILAGLGLTHLWWTELADLYEAA